MLWQICHDILEFFILITTSTLRGDVDPCTTQARVSYQKSDHVFDVEERFENPYLKSGGVLQERELGICNV